MKFASLVLAICVCVPAMAQKNKYDVVITNISYIDVNTGKLMLPGTIYIQDGYAQITNKKMKGATARQTIDGTGKFFMPALYDMHVHFPDNNAVRFFQLQLAAGIGTCRVMKSNSETVAFSRLDANVPTMKISYNFYGNETYSLDSLVTVVNSIKAKGYHFIKIFGVKDDAQFDAIMSAAKMNGLTVCGHALGKIDPKKLLASGYKSIEHVGYFDKAKTTTALDSLIDIAAKNNVFICPTLDWESMAYQAATRDSFQFRAGYTIGRKLYGQEWDSSYADNTKQFAGQEQRYKDFANDDISKKLSILAKMHVKGIRIIAGSDAEEPYQTPGFSLIDELKWIQKAGFSNAELLQMVTVNPRLYFSTNLSNPKTRNLETNSSYIVLSKNPLEQIGHLETVEYVIKGKELIDTKKLLESIQ